MSTLRPPPTKWIARLLSSECFVVVVVCCLLCFALLFLCSFFFLFFAAAATAATVHCWVAGVGISSLFFRYRVSLFVILFSSLLVLLVLLLLSLCTQRFARYMAMLRSFPEHEPVMLRLDDFVKRTNEYLRSNDLPSGGQLEHLLTRCGDDVKMLFFSFSLRCFSLLFFSSPDLLIIIIRATFTARLLTVLLFSFSSSFVCPCLSLSLLVSPCLALSLLTLCPSSFSFFPFLFFCV